MAEKNRTTGGPTWCEGETAAGPPPEVAFAEEFAREQTRHAPNEAIIQVAPTEDQSVIALYHEAQRLQVFAEVRIIITGEDVVLATEDLSILARLKKAIEEKRKEYVGPINEHLKAINEAFKKLTGPLEQADSLTRSKIMAYRTEERRKANEIAEINRLRMEAAQREMELQGELSESVNLVEVPTLPPATVRTDLGTLGTSQIWKFEVVDFKVLPDDYKIPDMVKIRKVVTAGASIPGVKSWKEDALRVSTR